MTLANTFDSDEFQRTAQEAEAHIKDALGIGKNSKTTKNSSARKSSAKKSPKGLKRVNSIDQEELNKMRQRVPDTEHLSRMRALLVKAHQNEYFIKKLAAGNSYVPENLNPEGSAHLG